MAKFDWKRWLLTRLLPGIAIFSLLLAVCLALVYSNRDKLLLRGSSGFLHHFTGMRNIVGSAEFLPDGNGYLIRDIRMRNPNVFRVRPEFATIRSLLIEMDKPPKKDGKLMVKRLVLDIDNINVVLWDRGVLNLSYLSGMRKKTSEMLGLDTEQDHSAQEDFLFFIQRLEVSIGNVTYTDTTGRRTAQSVNFSGERRFVFTELRGIPEVMRAVCALIVADRPIPSENLPITNYVAQFLGVARELPTAATLPPAENKDTESEQTVFNPNIIGQSGTSDEQAQRPQETDITDFGAEGAEGLPPDVETESQP